MSSIDQFSGLEEQRNAKATSREKIHRRAADVLQKIQLLLRDGNPDQWHVSLPLYKLGIAAQNSHENFLALWGEYPFHEQKAIRQELDVFLSSLKGVHRLMRFKKHE